MSQISYINKSKIIIKSGKKYFVKKRKIDISAIYQELENRGFNNYLAPLEINDNEEIYPYINEIFCRKEDRAIDIMLLLSQLHNKTMHFEKTNSDDLKGIYEDVIKRLDTAYYYYLSMQDTIEEHVYMSPAELLLMENISKVYYMINVSRQNIEKFYQLAEKKETIRKVQLHGNISLKHIVESKNKYLISWNASHVDFPVYDLLNFFKSDYRNIDFLPLLKKYNSNFPYTEEEENLFLALINIPPVIAINNSSYNNTIIVKNFVDYLNSVISLKLKDNEEKQEAD